MDSEEPTLPSFQSKIFLPDKDLSFSTDTYSAYISCISNTVEVFRYSVIDEGTQNTVPADKTLVKITRGNIRNNNNGILTAQIYCTNMGGNYIIGSVENPLIFNAEGFKTDNPATGRRDGFTLSHSVLSWNSRKDATCTESGCVGGVTCDYCERHFTNSTATTAIPLANWEIAALGHLLTKHPAQAATCSATGNVDYWSCGRSACLKNFSDAGATTEISDVTTAINPDAHKWGAPGYNWQLQSGNTLNGSVNYECTYNHDHTKADPAVLTVYSGTYDGDEHTGVTISSNTTEKTIEFSKDGTNWSDSISYTDAGTYNLRVRFEGQNSDYGTAIVTISPINISTATLTISFNGIPIYNGLVQVPDNISFALSGNTYIVKSSA